MSEPDHAQDCAISNPWQALRQLTQARIALGRSGTSLPTAPQLEFQLAHARARDAVYHPLDVNALVQALNEDGYDCQSVRSACPNRQVYLQRPDFGRKLDAASHLQLQELRRELQQKPKLLGELAVVIADGLSAFAIEQNVRLFLVQVHGPLAQAGWSLAPLVIVQQGRVAIGDEIGELLGARAVLMLIGERPGLSAPDSMGLYLTWAPRVGKTDAERNCISNIRPAGLNYGAAAHRLLYLLTEARRRGLSGVALKDETEVHQGISDGPVRNFLLK
jgi:ethanolamine ammonia-lyase small subunit